MNPGKIFCVAGLHRWEEQQVALAGDIHREERHCTQCGKRQIHIRMYPKVSHLAVYKLSRYVSYNDGDAIDTLTKHSLVPTAVR